MFISLVMGIITGWLFPEIGKNMHFLADIFLKMIKMIIAPLLFSVLVTGIASHSNFKSLGKLGLKTFSYFAVMALLALIIGLSAGILFKPGIDVTSSPIVDNNLSIAGTQFDYKFIDMIVNIIPESIVKALSEGNLLQIVFFSLFFALSICAAGEKGKPVFNLVSSLSEIMFKFTQFVMNFAPIGIFGAMAFTISENGIEIIAKYTKVIFSLYFALILFLVLIFTLACIITKIPFIALIKAVKKPAVIAFTTSTSDAALPLAMKSMEDFGVPKNIVGFVLPTGYTFNLDGSTLYLALAMMFSLQIAQVNLSLFQIINLMLILMLASKGVAGVPRAALIVLTATLTNFNYPIIGVTMLWGIDHILDMGRTTVNLIGNCIAAVILAKWENQFDYNKMKNFKTDNV